MRIVFRVDGAAQIGLGHVMRCLTLATQLLPSHNVTFLCCALPSTLQQQIQRAGITTLTTPSLHKGEREGNGSAVLNKAEQASHAAHCIALLDDINDEPIDMLIVDHYQLSASFSKVMRSRCKHIVVIDDLANRQHDCDVILDQNLFEDFEFRYDQLVPPHCQKLLGPEFAILRNEFYRPSSVPRNDNHILVCFGGSDPGNITERVVDVLIELKSLTFSADIVVGAAYSSVNALEAKVERLPNAKLHVACGHISELMKAANTMIGAGGSMHWERAASGVAGIIITLADNQVETTRCLHERHCCLWLGACDEVTNEDISKAVEFAINSPQEMRKLANNAASLVSANKNPSFVMDTILNIVTR